LKYPPLLTTTTSNINRFYRLAKVSFFFYFLIASICWGMFSVWEAQKELDEKTQTAESVIRLFVEDSQKELQALVNRTSLQCDAKQTSFLRTQTFQSKYAKELSLIKYGDNGLLSVYCTNLGPISIPIWRSIQKRLETSDKRFTMSYTKAKLTGQKSLFSFMIDESGVGANSVIPADLLVNELRNVLDESTVFRLFVLNRSLYYSPILSGTKDDLMVDFDRVWDHTKTSFLNHNLSIDIAITSEQIYKKRSSNVVLFLIIWIESATVTYLGLLWDREEVHSFKRYLKAAITNDEMTLHYQPIVDVRNGSIPKVEALLRWESERYGFVPPITIVEKASELGLMQELTQMVFNKVIDFLRRNDEKLKNTVININIDRGSFLNSCFIDSVTKTMNETPSLIGRIGFEVTENNNFNENEMLLALEQFYRLEACGINLSVDDFGTGYSGLDFLRQFPYETLKIDKVFITHLGHERVTSLILDYVVKLAKELDMNLIAEGVETHTQLEAINEMGIYLIQGYYFSKPLEETAFLEWFENSSNNKGKSQGKVALS